MDLKDTYNRIAEDWYQDHHEDTWWIDGTEKFISLLPSGSSVLDVGCGAGVKSNYLIKKGLRVTGIDFSEEMIALATEHVPGGRFFVSDLYDLSNITETFDAVFAQVVLLHIPKKDVLSIITRLISKIKPGGYFYAAVKERRADETEEETVQEDDYGYSYERFFSYFTKEEIERYFKNCELEIVYSETNHSGRRTWLQIIGKKKEA